jgi:outer membrane protein TolC
MARENVRVKRSTMVLRRGYLVALAVIVGCTNSHYRKSADKTAYSLIEQNRPLVENADPKFTIEQTNVISLDNLPVMTATEEAFGPEAEIERGTRIISLEKALEIAVYHSRAYQLRKEQLFLQALQLSVVQNQYTPFFTGRGRTDYQVTTAQGRRVIIDPITQEPKVELSDDLVEQHRVASGGSLGANWFLKTGAALSVAFTSDFLRYLTGDPRPFASSQLGATLVQPLWRGAGYKIATENLTQAERNLLYALRDFTRFRRDFSVQIATGYYGVLRNKDTARNAWRGIQNFRLNVDREKALAEEGLKTQASLGLLQQSELNTETSWIDAVRSYRQSLDQFKIQLGLSTDAHVVLDDNELAELKILHPSMDVGEAQEAALAMRLDLYTEHDQLADSKRRVALAANGLRPQIDLVSSVAVTSNPEGNGEAIPQWGRYRWNAGLNLDLPFERTVQRNNYRAAIIAEEQAARQLEQRQDEIKLQIRNDWRNLDQARRNFESSEIGVELSERRVQEQELRAQVGRGTARDLVDAQNDLIAQKNLRTQALVAHTIARLQFWNDMGVLYIKDNGRWEEGAAK